MLVLFVNRVEVFFQLTVTFARKIDIAFTAEFERTFVDKRGLVFCDAKFDIVTADFASPERLRCFRIFERESGGKLDVNRILLHVRVREKDRMNPRAGGKHRSARAVKNRRLNEQSFACALGVSRNANVE